MSPARDCSLRRAKGSTLGGIDFSLRSRPFRLGFRLDGPLLRRHLSHFPWCAKGTALGARHGWLCSRLVCRLLDVVLLGHAGVGEVKRKWRPALYG